MYVRHLYLYLNFCKLCTHDVYTGLADRRPSARSTLQQRSSQETAVRRRALTRQHLALAQRLQGVFIMKAQSGVHWLSSRDLGSTQGLLSGYIGCISNNYTEMPHSGFSGVWSYQPLTRPSEAILTQAHKHRAPHSRLQMTHPAQRNYNCESMNSPVCY